MSSKYTTVVSLSLCTLALSVFVLGCGTESEPITSKSSNYEVGDVESPAAAPETAAPATPPGAEPMIPGEVPPRRPAPLNQDPAVGANADDPVQPTPEQLLAEISRMRQQEPKGTTEDEVIADFVNLQMQVIQAVDMLLGLKPADDVVTEAASAKIDALTAASRLGAEGAMDQLFAFIEELEKHPSQEIQAFARQQSFGTLLNAYSTGQVTDSQQVIAAFKELAAEQPKEGGLLTFGRDVASRFIEKGQTKEAAELLRFTAGLVEPGDDPRLAAAKESLLEQAKFAEVDLGAKLNAVAEKEEGAIEEFTQMLTELTSGEQVGATTLQTLMQVASMLEAEHGEAAAKVYDALEASSGKSSDEEFAEIIQESIDKYRLRSAIVGEPFTLTGKLLDGTPFDWSKYRGKVVLVDFWATWCGPCLQEMPNIRANYEKYREHGFEVVGVNLDDDIEKLEEFSELQPLPWPSVLSADPDTTGWDHPMVDQYGVAAIPFLVLVDRDGTAIALNTRGPALGEKLAELFPDVASDDEPPAAASEAKPASEPPSPAEPEPAKPESNDTDPTPPVANEADSEAEE